MDRKHVWIFAAVAAVSLMAGCRASRIGHDRADGVVMADSRLRRTFSWSEIDSLMLSCRLVIDSARVDISADSSGNPSVSVTARRMMAEGMASKKVKVEEKDTINGLESVYAAGTVESSSDSRIEATGLPLGKITLYAAIALGLLGLLGLWRRS